MSCVLPGLRPPTGSSDRLRFVKRVVVFGRGGAGKSTLSRRLGDATGIPVVELDKLYWDDTLQALSSEEWGNRQSAIVAVDSWILDGDLGPLDVTEPRLSRADTVVIVDTPLVTCIRRALGRGRQRLDFWVWVLTWGMKNRPRILADVRLHAPSAAVIVLSSEGDVERWLASVGPDRH